MINSQNKIHLLSLKIDKTWETNSKNYNDTTNMNP